MTSRYWFHMEASVLDPWWMHISAPNFGTWRLPCREVDPDMFFPVERNGNEPNVVAAKKICSTCPVQQDCLDYAMACGTSIEGIWGGTTRGERAKIWRKMKKRNA